MKMLINRLNNQTLNYKVILRNNQILYVLNLQTMKISQIRKCNSQHFNNNKQMIAL